MESLLSNMPLFESTVPARFRSFCSRTLSSPFRKGQKDERIVFITEVHYQDSLQPEAPEELPERSRPDVCRSHTGKPPCTSATATFGASPAQTTTDDEVSLLHSRG